MVYKIGELASLLKVSKESLRSWERQGKIPKAQRRPTAHREYTDDDIKAIKEFLSKRKPVYFFNPSYEEMEVK